MLQFQAYLKGRKIDSLFISKLFQNYISLLLLFAPALMFLVLLILEKGNEKLPIKNDFPFLTWQLMVMIVAGTIATTGGYLDWRFHRKTLQLKISKKERIIEAMALGLGGLPMFFLMWIAMMNEKPTDFLIPIMIVLIFTVTSICYDEFLFHKKRCGKQENRYHKMLVFGNGIVWLSWFHFIYVK